MLGVLLESRSARQRRPGGTAVSVAAHVAIVGLIAAIPHHPRAEARPRPPAGPIVYVAPRESAPEAPRPTTSAAGERCTICETIPTRHGPTIHFPTTTGPTIPEPGTGAILDDDWGRAGPIVPGSVVGSATAPRTGEPWRADAVEHTATLLTTSVPRYPEALRSANIEGRAVVRFVVDTTGRAEPASVTFEAASHVLFENAVRDVLPRLRFRPATVGGRPVRVLVEMPFEFRLSR